jgi:hypothetical protein
MNRSKLKTYAPAARRSFLQAVKDRATHYGLTAKKIEPMTERGDVVLIAGQPFPKAVAAKRKRLEEHINKVGFERAIEAIAYSWFNRFVAIRFMELHGYLDHGYRVLSHPAGDVQPELLEHAQRVDFPGLDKNKVIELKLDGTKQEELYRLLLVAQCNALSRAMPFLFERIDDETELLLPSNLLATDSLIRKLVSEINEDDWKEVEILGWLYQFYISERKDEVIGKVVASEDIPAATQLFTPNWIVKYLVQNTLGRIWLATYPQSGIRQQMEFYIEPAEQTPEVQEQLKAITPTSLNPEELTLLDPACGSAHILVEAYDLFKAIYQERGYRAKDIPGLILSKNLYGLEIDDRAAQLAAFALFMKARADDRRIFEAGVQPSILSFVESKGMDAGAITHALNSPINGEAEGTVAKADIGALLELFEDAKTFGSLIKLPAAVAEKLPVVEERLTAVLKEGDLTHAQAGVIAPLLLQAKILARKYDAVVANPPYMGLKYQCPVLVRNIDRYYGDYSSNICTAFIPACCQLASADGCAALITMDGWMFGEDYTSARRQTLATTTLIANAHLGPRAFDEISGEVVQACAFVLRPFRSKEYRGAYFRLVAPKTSDGKRLLLLEGSQRYDVAPFFFEAFPRNVMAYYASEKTRGLFRGGEPLESCAEAFTGLQTGDNQRFIRFWHEVPVGCICFHRTPADGRTFSQKWFPYVKGSEYRKWYGNNRCVLDWQANGSQIRMHPSATVRNSEHYFKEGLAYNNIAKRFSARYVAGGSVFDQKNSMFIAKDAVFLLGTLGFLHSPVVEPLLEVVAHKDFNPGSLKVIPVETSFLRSERLQKVVQQLIEIARGDWDNNEVSWGFLASPLVLTGKPALSLAQEAHMKSRVSLAAMAKQLEEENNRLFIEAYGLQDELSHEVSDDQITLYRPDREEDIRRLLSYAVGCMMGRYSLDKEGLVYAHSGNEGFDASQYTKFPADEDGIVPVTEAAWFDDDAANRFERFVKTVWPAETLDENLAFVAESLGAKKTETPRETIRRYFAGDFYKHHLQTYKNRPIYWLFRSGKQGAFEALVYLHRYNEGTLSRMRTEYVVPLLGKMNGRIGMLADTIATATSTKQRKDAEKEKDKLTKQLAELQTFDEQLNHFASQRITLDLDDGVKVNYGKFGDLLADLKKVCGKAEDD